MKNILFFILLLPLSVVAQNVKTMGVSINNGLSGRNNEAIYNEIGLEFEQFVSSHSGFGYGMSFLHYTHDAYHASMNYIRMPFFYKIHTRFLNVSPTMSMDFICNRKLDPAIGWDSYDSYYPNLSFGFGLMLSRELELSKRFLLETKLQASYDLEDDPSCSIGLVFKHKI
jgi:hypothetical protein